MESFGARVKELRIAAGLSQEKYRRTDTVDWLAG